MSDERKYYCKEMEFICPNCGKKRSMGDVLNDSNAIIDDYEEIIYPDGFNQFKKNKSDRISITYDYYCEDCETHYDISLVCNCFAVEICDCETITSPVMSEYTEKEEEEDDKYAR